LWAASGFTFLPHSRKPVRPTAVNLDWRDRVRPSAERTFFQLLADPAQQKN
jgi:hypothetical protein